jgi:hypothetical protein
MGKTTEQANATWCPFSAVLMTNALGELVAGGAVAYNRIAKSGKPLTVPGEAACLGAGCAMWNWDSEIQDTGDCGLKMLKSRRIGDIEKVG